MAVGRNDPCPCGSGKKYKKCCLGKDRANPGPLPADFVGGSGQGPPTPPRLPARKAPARPSSLPPAPPPPPPRPLTPEQARKKARWDEFESQDAPGRIELFSRTLADKELLEDGMAHEMLGFLHQDAIDRGERHHFPGYVQSLRETLPEIYEESAARYLSWCLLDALSDGRRDDAARFARELVAIADSDVDVVFRSIHALAYHGELEILRETMRIGWPRVKNSSGILPRGIHEFANLGANYELYSYLEREPAPDLTDTTLLDRLKFYVEEPDLEVLTRYFENVLGRNPRVWTIEDFTRKPPRKETGTEWDDSPEEEDESEDVGADHLSLLTIQFVGYVRREEGVAFPTGDLARQSLWKYLTRRHEGELNPRLSMLEQVLHPKKTLPPPPKPLNPLCPERVTLEVFLGGLLGFLNNLLHEVATVFELIPSWLRFLESRQLIDAGIRRKVVVDLQPVYTSLLGLWEKQTDDPTLYHRIQKWSINAAMGPGELREKRKTTSEIQEG